MMINSRTYQQCSRCVMDTTDPDIFFDQQGICNHCKDYESLMLRLPFCLAEPQRKQELYKLVDKIKISGKGKRYDCIIGVSGGVDSTYLAWFVKSLGLRPLAIHLDNGWNSELAVDNIKNLVEKLKIDLYTHVINWEEFRNIQLSFLKASVPDCEVPTDHAIIALHYIIAQKENVKYIITGANSFTESAIPVSWTYSYTDWKYIRGIHGIYGTVPIQSFPFASPLKLKYFKHVLNIRQLLLLHYINYRKDEVKQYIQKELGWRDYGGKHYESVYTRFFQGYILPHKFGIDKRKAHLSSLIYSNQISREKALAELNSSPYQDDLLHTDFDFVLKKFDLSRAGFDEIMGLPIKSFRDYPNSMNLKNKYRKIKNLLNVK